MTMNDRLSTIITLGLTAYLGFYVFGLIMGVYSPGEVPYFTIPAFFFVGVLVLRMVAGRRRSAAVPPTQDELTRATRHLRETRGF
jgi:hypothetical protein